MHPQCALHLSFPLVRVSTKRHALGRAGKREHTDPCPASFNRSTKPVDGLGGFAESLPHSIGQNDAHCDIRTGGERGNSSPPMRPMMSWGRKVRLITVPNPLFGLGGKPFLVAAGSSLRAYTDLPRKSCAQPSVYTPICPGHKASLVG